MRRKDREMDKDFAFKIIDKAEYGVISVNDGEYPMALPISIVRENNKLFFHSARQGKKVDVFYDEMPVTAVFVTDVKVPDLYSETEIDEISKDENKFSTLVSSVFTTEFASAIVNGTLYEVSEDNEKRNVLKLISDKYTPSKMKYFDSAIASGMNNTRVYMIIIEEISSKRKKFAKDGHELKYMEEEYIE